VGALRRVAVLAIAGGLLVTSSVARAQIDNSAIAEELFNDAKRLLDQGKADLACPKFAESLRLSPTLGTRLNLARCYEVQGRTATAWGQYKEVIRLGATDMKRATVAAERVAALEPKLSRVLLNGKMEPGLKIKLDVDVLDAAILGTAFPIDPGDHQLELSAPGKTTRTMTVHVTAGGQTQTVDIAPLEAEGEAPPPTPIVVAPAPPPPTTEVSQGKLIGGWVAIGGGIVALGFGIAFGVTTLGLASDVATGCLASGPCPTQDLLDKNSTAHTFAILADVLIPVGVVAAGLGTWLVATASHHPKSNVTGIRVLPLLSPSSGGVALGGRF
jgi:hypothetical protein